jgi:signal transduction histidine kinase
LEKIFVMFYRASDKSSGSGLGLYIAKESANKINANLFVESVVGEGSKFTLVIPG